MPDLYVDFSWVHPDPGLLVSSGVRGILVYVSPNPQGQFNTPSQAYLEDCVARGVQVCPIFEQGATQASEGYDRGRTDGDRAPAWLGRAGFPDGVRLWVNVADTPSSAGSLQAIMDYSAGFAETFPMDFQLGAYGNLGALRIAQQGSARFGKLWAVETWYPGASGNPEVNWQHWLTEADVALVQMANIPPPLAGTDTNWLVPGYVLDGWGGTPPTIHGIGSPLRRPLKVNSPFGPRGASMHWGIDLEAFNGDDAVAVADGDCIYAAYEDGGGNHLVVAFTEPPAPNAPKYGYMHLQDFAVGPGDHVQAGQLVGHTNNTGSSTGPHLHFWMGDNANVGAVDPTPYLFAGPPPVPVNWDDVAAFAAALEGDSSMAMVPNFVGSEVTMHVNANGELVHNSRNLYGVPNVTNEILARGCDRAVQPAMRVDGQHLIVSVASVDGDARRIVYLAEKGGWVTDPGNIEWKIGADA